MPYQGNVLTVDCTFSFAQVSAALAEIHSIAPARVSAFRARLKHYQKMGFPSGINTGRGRAASYNIGHALQLAVVLETNQMGLLPERASKIVEWNLDRVKTALGLILFGMLEKQPSDSLPMFLSFDPNGLDDLQLPEIDRADETFNYGGIGVFLERVKNWAEQVPRYAVINLTVMTNKFLPALASSSGVPISDLKQAAYTWSHDHGDDQEA